MQVHRAHAEPSVYQTEGINATTSAKIRRRDASTIAGMRLVSMSHFRRARLRWDASERGLSKPPVTRKTSSTASATHSPESSADEGTSKSKKAPTTKKKKSAKALFGKAVEQDGDDADISDFVKSSKSSLSANTAKKNSSVTRTTMPVLPPLLEDDEDDEDLPDLAQAARMPSKTKKTEKAVSALLLSESPPASPKKGRKAGKGKQKNDDRNSALKARTSDDGSELEDPWSDAEEDDEFAKLPPPVASYKVPASPATRPSRKNSTTSASPVKDKSISLSPPKPKPAKSKPIAKVPSMAQSELSTLSEELRNLDDQHNRPHESDGAESEYGREDDPEPVGSEAEEDNKPDEGGKTSDEGEGDLLDFYDDIVIEDEQKEWENMK